MTVSQFTLTASSLVLDASVVINLLGCGHAYDVLSAVGRPFIIEERTAKEIKRHPISGRCHIRELAELEGAGVLRRYRMSNDAYELYLRLVDDDNPDCLDDGESAAIATAANLKFCVVLDDRKARRVHAERFPEIPFISTLRLFLAAAEGDSAVAAKLPQVINAAVLNSRMSILREERELFQHIVN